MKRRSVSTKIISIIFFVGLMAYLTFYIYNGLTSPYRTVVALRYTADEGVSVSGFIVRSESLVKCQYQIVDVTIGDGEKVAAGQIIATAYQDETSLSRQLEIRALQSEVDQLTVILNTEVTAATMARADASIRGNLLKLSSSVERQELSDVDVISSEIKTALIRRDYSFDEAVAREHLSTLNTRLYSLIDTAAGGTTYIVNDLPGLFSSRVDGFEHVSPAALNNLSVSGFNVLMNASPTFQNNSIGKIVEGIWWYYAVTLPEGEASRLNVNGSVSVRLSSEYDEYLEMYVESVSDPADGICVAVLRCNTAMSETSYLRKQSADIVYERHSGILVPKEALRLDDKGRTCVYTLLGLQANCRLVDIVYEAPTYYLVKNNPLNSVEFHEGDQIIIGSRDLYDGKVVG